jgi:hypothetical protein
MTSTEGTPRQGIRPPYAGVGLAVLAMVTTLVGVFTFGFLSGVPIVIDYRMDTPSARAFLGQYVMLS